MTPSERMRDARAMVADADRVVILTGAGVSAESGVPTFRGERGLWRSYRPEELATPQAFARDPELVWAWYGWRRGLVAECVPNDGHHAIARHGLERRGRTTLVTQNVDGLHHRAARDVAASMHREPDPAYPIEVHGALHRDRCSGCGVRRDGPPGPHPPPLPTCPDCHALLRPDVVWFGEALDPSVIGAAMDAARAADLCIVAGTSAVVYPAASIPDVTLGGGGRVIEINLEPTPLTGRATITLEGPSGGLLPAVLDPD